MPTLVARNTIKLDATASATAGFYVGYSIVVTRLHKLTGKKSVQKYIITAYTGSTTKVATIDGLWAEDLIPGVEDSIKKDTFSIIPTYSDSRVSTNPAIQSMDYITSNRYGRGLDPIEDLDLTSWMDAARTCDIKSDITVEAVAGTVAPAVGDVYKYPATGDILWQGTVSSVSGLFFKFSNVFGKLTNQWNSWKNFPVDAIVYNSNKTYLSTVAGVRATAPTHTTGTPGNFTYIATSFALTKVSGTGPTPLYLPSGGNPIRIKKNGMYMSGYSLYDADGVNYWRYLGWDEHDQRYVSQHQTNLMIDTSAPLFDNMNSLLEHFGGMLRYSAGKYSLDIEQAETGTILTTDPRNISSDDIVGKIKISDDGIRSAYNSLTVAFADPANKYESRNISFFNSEYLKADRNVPKKGNLSIPGITNYYNARLLADKVLTKSRYGLTVSFNMSPKAMLLLTGRVVQIPYARYGWVNKKFRITDITFNSDTSADVVAEEYDDSFYAIKPMSQTNSVGVSPNAVPTTIGSPTNLVATSDSTNNEGVDGIELTWTNNIILGAGNVSTEIHMSSNPNYTINTTGTATANTYSTSTAHLLVPGDRVRYTSGGYGAYPLGNNQIYYVKTVPSSTTFTLTATKGGTVVAVAVDATAVIFTTAVVIATVPIPESTYFDTSSNGETGQVEKYYWIRYVIAE